MKILTHTITSKFDGKQGQPHLEGGKICTRLSPPLQITEADAHRQVADLLERREDTEEALKFWQHVVANFDTLTEEAAS